jgi:hypothetical protein
MKSMHLYSGFILGLGHIWRTPSMTGERDKEKENDKMFHTTYYLFSLRLYIKIVPVDINANAKAHSPDGIFPNLELPLHTASPSIAPSHLS